MNSKLSGLFLFIALVIVIASVLFTNNLARQLAAEEHHKIEIWAEATRQFIGADENTDINFVSSIIEGNTTIPVYMVDADGNILITRNVPDSTENDRKKALKTVRSLMQEQKPIEVKINDDVTQYIYYDDSSLLKQLYWFPYIEFLIIAIFILIVLFAYRNAQRSEQNRVWVGLSKETAHQLGTPISSLNGWIELLKVQYPDDGNILEMQKDTDRLQIVADRFGKIGSVPELQPENIVDVIDDTINYMKQRTSKHVSYVFTSHSQYIIVSINKPLFQWVIENLCKNAIDAIEGDGKITISIRQNQQKTEIDISDTGKGIERSNQRKIFSPGYTTKQRGWGLGLNLSKRIIEDYHSGKLQLVESKIGIGTTFRITI